MERLIPRLDVLGAEYVLIQAWKKTAAYIRYHNWYADTLELDRVAINLPEFLDDLSKRIRTPDQWVNGPLRMVPAPKSQNWRVVGKSKRWEPVRGTRIETKLRPLAHVELSSQVMSTAIMMCLADQVESLQSDPRLSPDDPGARYALISYGNRLFCDRDDDGRLHHRWGSSKLYRGYYADYRAFIARSEYVANQTEESDGRRTILVHSDLRQFYDRVRPKLLQAKIAAAFRGNAEPEFFELVARALQWTWHDHDVREAEEFARHAGIENFLQVAIPQGLVAGGFFANVVLLDFDESLRAAMSTDLVPGLTLRDCSRYVDDLRLVISAEETISLADVEERVAGWLQALLETAAPGLQVSRDKTRASALRTDERPLVRQSRKMERIQTAISGGFDAVAGAEILDAVQGLIRTQEAFSDAEVEDGGWDFAPIADVRDATVARFAAGRYRTTYRSLRPMLMGGLQREGLDLEDEVADLDLAQSRKARTQLDLDEDARAFALGLIQSWIRDPSNVRLMRIGLDLWPAVDVLEGILELLRPYTSSKSRRVANRRVAWYCLAEIFRAGATETGFVNDDECLPAALSIDAYRARLRQEAIRLAGVEGKRLPWYLKQQVLLFLAANDPAQGPFIRPQSSPETKHYQELICYLRGDPVSGESVEDATLAVLARRAFVGREKAIQLATGQLRARDLESISERDPAFAIEILASRPESALNISAIRRDDLCLNWEASENASSLAAIVLRNRATHPLRNEFTALAFSIQFLNECRTVAFSTISPLNVHIELNGANSRMNEVSSVRISVTEAAEQDSLYSPPKWCTKEQSWRFHLGYLLRFLLTGYQDFTRTVRPESWKEREAIYRSGLSHWYQRLHGLFNAYEGFGDDWLPVTDWMEQFLSALLRWPGQRTARSFQFVDDGLDVTILNCEARLATLRKMCGEATGLPMLPLFAPLPYAWPSDRPLRGCVLQSVIPGGHDFKKDDLTCSSPALRKRHRRHLSASLAAIERMLDLRETHRGSNGRLDWLILPELAVHPDDIRTHLVPFARAHKTIILAGVTYQELLPNEPLINSAIWIVPAQDPTQGLQTRVRRQGKGNLAPVEAEFNQDQLRVREFRPGQWLVGYHWSAQSKADPLWLTAAICYDATDLKLAADLRDRSDVFAVPALNQDVGTFDQMALALHYHMYQMVVVANNGSFGGSNAYAPYAKPWHRQVFHMHGQPQASVAFFEIDPVANFKRRKSKAPGDDWKSPPAGLDEELNAVRLSRLE